MFDSEHKDKQVEFFDDYSCMSKKPHSARFGLGKIALSLSYENIIILSIGFIMFLIVCYSLGVEKGKYLAKLSYDVDVIQIKAQPALAQGSSKTTTTTIVKETPVSAAPKEASVKEIKAKETGAKQTSVKETIKPKEETLPKKTAEEKKTPAPQEKKVKIKIADAPLYTIQVATFRNSSSVQKETERLKKIGYKSFAISNNNLTEVCIGNYKSKVEATKDLEKLKKLYRDCYVRMVKQKI